MNPTTWYCRLCAGLKLRNKLVNLQIDDDLCQKVIKKLERFHITMDFQDNILPKTVCLLCIKSLEQAFKFVCAVEEAQSFLSDFVMVQCTDDLEEDSMSYELVSPSNCTPSPLGGAQDSMEMDIEDCYSNDQVKCENNSDDNSNDHDFKLEYEDEIAQSEISHTVATTVDEQIIPMFNISDNQLCNNTNINTTLHEDITNHDINAICQDINTDEFDTNVSEVVENQQNTTTRKIIKKNKRLKKSVATPKKNNEIKTIPDMENYSEDDIKELFEKLGDVPVQYITKTWQDITWHCVHCETQFTSMETLQKHCMEVHNSCNSYKCGDCPIRSSNLKFFLKHLRIHHKYLHYSCYKCYRKFPNMAGTIKHLNNSHKFPNKCSGCLNNFPTKKQLKEHIDKYCKKICEFKKIIIKKNKTLKKSVATPKKNNEIKTIPDMENYSEDDIKELFEKLGDVPVQYITKTWRDITWHCVHCETKFTSMETLQKHCMEVHNSCNSYKCGDCPIRSSNLKFFLKHLRIHHKYLHYSCYKCYRKFPNMAATIKHLNNSHKVPNKCSGCFNTFPTKEQLKKHKDKYCKRISDFKKYNHLRKDNSCHICHKVCKNYARMRHHYLTQHTKDSAVICDICGKSFRGKYSFNNHMVTHGDRETFQCNICEVSLKSRYILKSHMELHTGIKPYICDICGKRFRKKSQIRNHLIIHTDNLPYACSVCGKKFRNNASRKNHMLQHTGAKPFSCNICLREFTNLANRNKHARRKHGIELAKRRLIKTNQVKVPGETTEAENIRTKNDIL